jgi:hypothetical protein
MGETARCENDHNVYVLGAGFSAGAGLPLVAGFLNRMRDAQPWLQSNGRLREAEAISKVLEFRLRAASASYRIHLDLENIEELFSLAAAAQGESVAQDVTLAISATIDFARTKGPEGTLPAQILDPLPSPLPKSWKRNSEYSTSGPSGNFTLGVYECPIYELLILLMVGWPIAQIDRRNTFITFNYDLVAEDALDAVQVPYWYGLKSEHVGFDESARCSRTVADVRLLKLHGSINWVRHDPNPVCQRAVQGFGPQIPTVVRVFGGYQQVREQQLVPLLVPPTWKQSIGSDLSGVWDEAVASLRTATRLFIVGYSFPSTDQHFKYLLAAGLQENISLRKIYFVNPAAESLKSRLSAVFREDHFRNGLIELISQDAQSWLNNRSVQAVINRSINTPIP